MSTMTLLPPRPDRAPIADVVEPPPVRTDTFDWAGALARAARVAGEWILVEGDHAATSAVALRIGKLGGKETRPIEVVSRRYGNKPGRVAIWIKYVGPKS
jgi:hypothetical protein